MSSSSGGAPLRSARLAAFVAAFLALLAGCGFQLRGEPAPGVNRLMVSSDVPSRVAVDLRRILGAGPARLVDSPADAEAHLRILAESREKSVFTLTGAGRVYEHQLRLAVRYQLAAPGLEEPLIAPIEIEARRLVTYSEIAPVAKETEEEVLYRDMQTDLARQILRHIGAVTRRLP